MTSTEQRAKDQAHAEAIRLSIVPTKQFAVIRGELERAARRALLLELADLLKTGYSTFPASDSEILEHARFHIASEIADGIARPICGASPFPAVADCPHGQQAAHPTPPQGSSQVESDQQTRPVRGSDAQGAVRAYGIDALEEAEAKAVTAKKRMYWARVERVEDWTIGQTTAVVRQGFDGESTMGRGVVGAIERERKLVLVEMLSPGELPP